MNKKTIFRAISFLVFLVALGGRPAAGSTVAVVKLKDTIQPVSAEFLEKTLATANKEPDTKLIVIELDTPGGLLSSTRDITTAIMSSRKPVAVYVHPAGGRAASAGFFILLSSDYPSMTLGTNAGAAHPVSSIPFLNHQSDKKKDQSVMEDKIVEDTAAFIRSIAERRNRPVEPAELAVRKSIAYSAKECLKNGLIDFIAPSLENLVKQIATAHPELGINPGETFRTQIYEYSFREQLLSRLASPEIAYLLFLAGIIGVFIELKSPGVIFPGLFGAICLILFFYASRILPVNFAGMLFIVLAVVLFALEVKVVSYGFLTIGGIISMIIGSAMLFKSDLPGLSISVGSILLISVFFAIFVVLLIRLVVKAHRNKPLAGEESLVGMAGYAVSAFEHTGKIFLNGEYWDAVSETPVEAKQPIEVVRVDNMTLHIKPKEG